MSEMGPGEYFICGGFGGICTVLIGHPLDTIKVRLQTMPIPKTGESLLYTSTLDCFKKTVRNEGFKGLYKGMGPPLVGVAPIFSISFMGYGVGKKMFGPSDGTRHSYLEYFTAGAFSGVFTTIIMAPGERIKCLLQIQQGTSTPKVYDGPVDCAKKLYKQGGVRSIYRGAGATLLRVTRNAFVDGKVARMNNFLFAFAYTHGLPIAHFTGEMPWVVCKPKKLGMYSRENFERQLPEFVAVQAGTDCVDVGCFVRRTILFEQKRRTCVAQRLRMYLAVKSDAPYVEDDIVVCSGGRISRIVKKEKIEQMVVEEKPVFSY